MHVARPFLSLALSRSLTHPCTCGPPHHQVAAARAAHSTPRLPSGDEGGLSPRESSLASPTGPVVCLADVVNDAVGSAALDQLQSFRQLLLATSSAAEGGQKAPAAKSIASLVCDFCKDSTTFGLPELTQVGG